MLLALAIALNFTLVAITIAWFYFKANVFSAELRVFGTLSCFHVDLNGLYVTFLPPQDGLGGKDFASLSKLELQNGVTPIERNLSTMPNQVTLPGIAFWRTTENYSRLIARLRFSFLLTSMLLLRLGLWRFKARKDPETTAA